MQVVRNTPDATLPLDLRIVLETEAELADFYARMFWEPHATCDNDLTEPEFTESDELFETVRDFVEEYQQELH